MTMKLAKEITEGLLTIDYVVDTTSNGPWVVRYGAFELGSRFATKADAESACSQHRNRLASIIAVKLEPVRVALQEMCDHSGLMGYLEMHHPALRCVAEEALAKLSEEA